MAAPSDLVEAVYHAIYDQVEANGKVDRECAKRAIETVGEAVRVVTDQVRAGGLYDATALLRIERLVS